MKQKIIRELIHSFISNYVPSQVRSSFASWFLDKADAEEKDRALEEIWDEMSLEKEHFDFGDELPSAKSILSDAEAIENPSGAKKIGFYRRLAVISGAAACLCLLLTGSLFLVRNKDSKTVLMAVDSKIYYELPDGSSIWLNKGSTLSYFNDLKGRNRRLHLDGEAFFDVAKDPKHPFVIATEEFDVKVLGTRFTLSAYGDSKKSVYLESGKVALNSPHFDSEILMPGEAFTFDPVTGQASHYKEKAVNHLSWTRDKLEFANASLRDIVTNLEHWYNVKISMTGDAGNEHLSLTVRKEPLNEILDAISCISGISYTINDNEITIY